MIWLIELQEKHSMKKTNETVYIYIMDTIADLQYDNQLQALSIQKHQ